MKPFILSFFLFTSFSIFAQSDKYVEAMQKNISLLDAAKTTQDFQTAANAFERIGEAEKTQWLPYYYAGLSLARAGWMDRRD